jgi:hypothetical protein
MTGRVSQKVLISDKADAAYRRRDLFEKRRLLIADWADFLGRQPAEVVPLAGKRGEHAEAPRCITCIVPSPSRRATDADIKGR